VDQPALQPLPLEPYVYAEWRTARVNIDSHLEVEGHYYSVPSPLVHTDLGRAADGDHGRVLPQEPAGGQPCAERRAWPAHHRRRASPVVAPTVSGVVAVTADSVGGDHWARHGGGGEYALDPPPASRTRLSLVPRGLAAGTPLRPGRGWKRRATAPRRLTRSPTRVSSRSSRPGSTSSRSPSRFRRSPSQLRARPSARHHLLPTPRRRSLMLRHPTLAPWRP
jgi:hypothetical protein